jgi:hypothetical protein
LTVLTMSAEITIKTALVIFMLTTNTNTMALHGFQIIPFAWRPLSRISYVLVVPPKPRHWFVPPIRCPIEPLVHSPERVEAPRVGGVCVVDDTLKESECTHARRLAGVGRDVGASHGREPAGDQGVLTVL